MVYFCLHYWKCTVQKTKQTMTGCSVIICIIWRDAMPDCVTEITSLALGWHVEHVNRDCLSVRTALLNALEMHRSRFFIGVLLQAGRMTGGRWGGRVGRRVGRESMYIVNASLWRKMVISNQTVNITLTFTSSTGSTESSDSRDSTSDRKSSPRNSMCGKSVQSACAVSYFHLWADWIYHISPPPPHPPHSLINGTTFG